MYCAPEKMFDLNLPLRIYDLSRKRLLVLKEMIHIPPNENRDIMFLFHQPIIDSNDYLFLVCAWFSRFFVNLLLNGSSLHQCDTFICVRCKNVSFLSRVFRFNDCEEEYNGCAAISFHLAYSQSEDGEASNTSINICERHMWWQKLKWRLHN